MYYRIYNPKHLKVMLIVSWIGMPIVSLVCAYAAYDRYLQSQDPAYAVICNLYGRCSGWQWYAGFAAMFFVMTVISIACRKRTMERNEALWNKLHS